MRHLRFPAMLFAAVLASCSLEVPSEAGSIVLYMEVDKAILLPDEVMTITVRAQNVGYDRLTLTGPSDCLLYIEIRNSGNTIVHTSLGSCVGSTVTEEVEAGADKVMEFTWDGVTQSGTRAASGLYSIRATARVTGDPYRGPALTVAVE